MKRIFIGLLCASVFIFSCTTNTEKSERGIVIGDTITTDSGLQYIFLKEGAGRKIEEGSKVKVVTDLYVNDADTIFWTTTTSKDSTFAFVHKKTSLIKGFAELHDYLVEGDEVIAILPDSIAYGKRARGAMPPGATLIYNPLFVKYVSEPKEVVTDTIKSILKNKSVEAAIAFLEDAENNKLDIKYHTDMTSMVDVVMSVSRDSMYSELEKISDYLLKKSDDADASQSFYYGKILALEQLGRIDEAIKIAEPLTKQELNKDYWNTVLKSLKEK